MQFDFKNKIFIYLLLVIMATGCAGREHPQSENGNTQVTTNNADSLESYNRSIYKFNTKLDKYLLKPLAKTYRKITPKPVESGIYKFFENLQEPRNIVNSLLQGKIDYAGISAGRFVLNSTVGVLGFFDVAGKLDIPKHEEDFGQTLAAWGVPAGPYVVLPLFGPRYLRHAGGMIPDFVIGSSYSFSDDSVRYGLLALNIIQTRTRLLGTDNLLELQLDPYVFVRESYKQLRQVQLQDLDQTASSENEFDDDFDENNNDEI